jgi:hypothetical protein
MHIQLTALLWYFFMGTSIVCFVLSIIAHFAHATNTKFLMVMLLMSLASVSFLTEQYPLLAASFLYAVQVACCFLAAVAAIVFAERMTITYHHG